MDASPKPALDTTASEIPLTIEFTGGLEMLFSHQRKHHIRLPSTCTIPPTSEGPADIKFLVDWLVANLMRDSRTELFVLDGSVRPGILVLINDADWELEGEEKYVLRSGDNVLFVSTLHGG